MQDPAAQARKFLQLLYEHKPEDAYILIWQLHGRKSHFFKTIDAAADCAYFLAKDVYFGVALSPEDYGPASRCASDKTAGIGGVWADIDFFHPTAHKKPGLPPTEQSAYEVLKSMDAKPTLVIHSGYGLQAYWVFKEPWIFVDDADRKKAADLSARWNQYVVKTAAAKGWSADSLGDLARVMRVPGTMNGKEDPAVPVRWKYGNTERRWNPSDLIEILDELKISATAAEDNQGKDWRREAEDGLVFSPDRQPPIDKFTALKKKSRKFANTMEHRRPELKDQSTSGYDLALAIIAARNEWTDQEIIDLLIYHQREKRTGGVRDRPQYFRETIAKARKITAPDPALNTLRAAAGPPAPDYQAPDQEPAEPEKRRAKPPEDRPAPTPAEDSKEFRAQTLQALSEVFKVKIKRITKTMSEPPLFMILTDRGDVSIGEVQNLIEQRALRNRMAMVGVYLRKRPEEEWEPIATALLRVCEPEEVTPDATNTGQLNIWLCDYFRESNILDSIEDAEGDEPFKKDGSLHISSSDLRKFLLVSNGERGISSSELCQMLRRSGASPRHHAVKTKSGRYTTKYRWCLGGGCRPICMKPYHFIHFSTFTIIEAKKC